MHIAIIGGGTAAWLSAAYLRRKHPRSQITVIDKTVGTPIGVGEATILDFGPFMQECGFKLEQWLAEVDGTFKSGLLFEDWGKAGNTIWHPFFTHITYKEYGQWDIWSTDQSKPFEQYGLPMYDVALANKVDFGHLGNYAYHVDCSKLVNYIQRQISPTIQVVNSDVVTVVKDGTTVTELILDNGRAFSADLFVDCTGSSSILKTQDRVDLSDRLFCNTAIAGQVSYQDRASELKPYAISTAVECGWIWKIAVSSRLGSGLVFNRDVTDVEDAKDVFVKHWGGRVSKENLRVIKWDPYYIKNQWEGNVVSIGLSAGFVEPLESTGISMMIKGITRVSDKIRTGHYTKFDADLFNAQMINVYEDVVNYISMHYSNSERTEPFWQYVRDNFKTSETLEFYKHLLSDTNMSFSLNADYLLDNKMFHATNWILWMIQLNYPVRKQVNWNLQHINSLNEVFRNAEEQRVLASIPHTDAIALTTLASKV